MYFYKIIFTIVTFCVALSAVAQQTPIESLIQKYEDSLGARSFVAQGLKMMLARKLIEQTDVAPIAADVKVLYVIRMAGVAQGTRLNFVSELYKVLESYHYYGTIPSKNGTVDVYLKYSTPEIIEELVIYNPAIYALNSLFGKFSMQELLQLRDQVKE